MSESSSNGKVLILDGDSSFRTLTGKLLSGRGFAVLQAASVAGASKLIEEHEIRLLIADKNMKDLNHYWVAEAMSVHSPFAIIFVGEDWCGKEEFEDFRSAARASLFVKKPVVPEVFVQQVELLTPRIIPSHDGDEGIADHAFEEPDDPESPAQMLKQLIKLRSKLEVKTALKVAQIAYLQELQSEWHLLSEALKELSPQKQSQKSSQKTVKKGTANKTTKRNQAKKSEVELHRYGLLQEALESAHKIKGTAGSLNLPRVSEVAGNLERCLKAITLDTPADDILFSETAQFASDGERTVKDAVKEAEGVSIEPQALIKLLVLGSGLSEMTTAIHECSVQMTSDVGAAESKAKRWNFDAAVIDAKAIATEQLHKLVFELRTTAGEALPIAIVDTAQKLSDAEALYIGISERVAMPNNGAELNGLTQRLLSDRRAQKPHVLLIDDDQVLTGFIGSVLTAQGLDVRAVNSPLDASRTLDDFSPDLAILDVSMPGMTGYEVCRMIRERAAFASMPILFLTGTSSADSRSSAFLAGADDFLAKPVVMEELVTRVAAQLNKSAKLHGRSLKDEWTGLLTEDAFFRNAEPRLAIAKEENRKATMCVISVLGVEQLRMTEEPSALKQIFSALGHLIGVRFRSSDLRGRVGGNDFAVLCLDEDARTCREALTLLEKDIRAMEFECKSPLRLGLGTASMDEAHAEPGLLFRQAFKTARMLGSVAT